MEIADYGFLSVIPPIVTIVLAILTRNVFVSLFIGIFLGYSVMNHFHLIVALNQTLNGIIDVFGDHGNTIVIASLLMIGALIHMIEKSGGIDGFIEIMVRKKGIIKSKRAANLFTWLLGIFVFTSGTLSSMVVGSVSRPVNDALKVPHEKAAFLVHTTSTPVCVLIPLSGWAASMIGYLTSGGIAESEAPRILLESIGLNFYCLLAVIMALVISITQKDFGPMRKAELRAAQTGQLDDPARHPEQDMTGDGRVSKVEKPLARNLLVPILVLIGTILIVLAVTGKGSLVDGDGMNALLWGVTMSLFASAFLCFTQKTYKLQEYVTEAFRGAGDMLPIAMVLVFGFAMGTVVKAMGTGNYLSEVFAKFLAPGLLPVLVFLMACLISFATGTSMGTMAITSVLALPMAAALDVSIPLVAAAVWGGSIFGDHASPISDTTIMSCSTTGCDIIDHVKTQMPYCLFCAGVTIVLYLIAGFL